MTDILLHLWRVSFRYSTASGPFFQMNDTRQSARHRQEYFARGIGTADRFILRIYDNPSTSPMTWTFQVNGVIKATISILAGQIGTFLPASQLPVPFAKDDLLVIGISGQAGPDNVRAEIDLDLKFTT